jgi:CHAT domain-containing protein
MFSLPLSAEIVVLSACRTGLGRLLQGEGIIGMGRALFYAGAGSLVLSLWPVADDSTADLMVAFYAALREGLQPAEALRSAKLITQRTYDDPFNWAPFILVGLGW